MRFRSVVIAFILLVSVACFTSCNHTSPENTYFKSFWIEKQRMLMCGDTWFTVSEDFSDISVSRKLDFVVTETNDFISALYGIKDGMGVINSWGSFRASKYVDPPARSLVLEKMKGAWGRVLTPKLRYFALWRFNNNESFFIWVYTAKMANSDSGKEVVVSVSTSLEGGLISWTTPTVLDAFSARYVQDMCWYDYLTDTGGLPPFEHSVSHLDCTTYSFVHKIRNSPFGKIIRAETSFQPSVWITDGVFVPVGPAIGGLTRQGEVYSMGLHLPGHIDFDSGIELRTAEPPETKDSRYGTSRYWPIGVFLHFSDRVRRENVLPVCYSLTHSGVVQTLPSDSSYMQRTGFVSSESESSFVNTLGFAECVSTDESSAFSSSESSLVNMLSFAKCVSIDDRIAFVFGKRGDAVRLYRIGKSSNGAADWKYVLRKVAECAWP
ncbi:MAG: hypothetical protein U5N86_10490 [Planctomycetota bacterium]|nr:hypothetical protein [Planctomycetota bacterium]